MKKVSSFLFAVLLSSAVFAQSTWKSDPAHSKLAFTVVHSGISDVSGLFKTFDATVVTSSDDFSDAVFTLSVDVNSVDTEVEMRDNHLRSADFFDVAKFPQMTYKSTAIKKVGENKYQLTGDLTLHGITKPVTLDLLYRGTNENAERKTQTAGFQLTGIIKRSDFGVGGLSPAISDEVRIKADGEFKKQ